jgi:Uncharacterised nucleotidyltransferase
MRRDQLKLAAILALREQPDFANLWALGFSSDREMRRFLRWLDESGLALYLLGRLQNAHEIDRLPSLFCFRLQRRFESNRKRTAVILAALHQLSTSLTARRIPHAFLKGFTLVPDFCSAIELRHQSDIDILVSPEFAERAKLAMQERGYSMRELLRTGEIHFSKPRSKPPSIHDDIYTSNFHPEVELHMSIWKDLDHVSLNVRDDGLSRLRIQQINGVRLACLSIEDTFVAQILHAFRHLLGSWIRVAWLFEIHSFIVRHAENEPLWSEINERTTADPELRNAFGLVLQLTNQLFPSPIPNVMREWCIDPLPGPLSQWVAEFGTRWALSDLSGSKLSLLVHREFIKDAVSRRSYVWRRMFPFAGKPTLGRVHSQDVKTPVSAKVAEGRFLARRALFHAASLCSFSIDAVRWARILRLCRKQGAIAG